MTAVLNTNMTSLYTQKGLSTAQLELTNSVQRLSSGKRINSAKDDAAGYSVSESVKATKNITDQSIHNVQDAISVVQTSSGALEAVSKILQRVLVLTTQKIDSTLTSSQLSSVNNEVASLLNEIGNIKNRTRLQGNGNSLFASTQTYGTGSGTSIEIKITDLSLAMNGTATMSMNQFTTLITESQTNWSNDGKLHIPPALGVVTSDQIGQSVFFGNHQKASDITITSVSTDHLGNSVVELLGDIDQAVATFFAFYPDEIEFDALYTFGNPQGLMLVGLSVFDDPAAQGLIANSDYFDVDGSIKQLTGAQVTNLSSANVQRAIDQNSTNQGSLGAYQNRLDYVVDNLQTLSNNLADAQSRILDTDYAAETATLTRGQIMQEAAAAMLAQANQMPNVVLMLLE
jgi:flagellin